MVERCYLNPIPASSKLDIVEAFELKWLSPYRSGLTTLECWQPSQELQGSLARKLHFLFPLQ